MSDHERLVLLKGTLGGKPRMLDCFGSTEALVRIDLHHLVDQVFDLGRKGILTLVLAQDALHYLLTLILDLLLNNIFVVTWKGKLAC